jgi:hypothetical protein
MESRTGDAASAVFVRYLLLLQDEWSGDRARMNDDGLNRCCMADKDRGMATVAKEGILMTIQDDKDLDFQTSKR